MTAKSKRNWIAIGALLLMAGTANAATFRSNIHGGQITVDPACRFRVPQNINMQIGVTRPAVKLQSAVTMLCPNMTAFRIETNASASGKIDALAGSHDPIPVYVYQGTVGGPLTALGKFSDGKHLSATADGTTQSIKFWLVANSDDGGATPLVLPSSFGVIRTATINWTVTY